MTFEELQAAVLEPGQKDWKMLHEEASKMLSGLSEEEEIALLSKGWMIFEIITMSYISSPEYIEKQAQNVNK